MGGEYRGDMETAHLRTTLVYPALGFYCWVGRTGSTRSGVEVFGLRGLGCRVWSLGVCNEDAELRM